MNIIDVQNFLFMLVDAVPTVNLKLQTVNLLFLPPRYNLKIHKSRCQSVRHSEDISLEIFYQHVRNCIRPVNEIEYFKACPDAFKISEWRVTPTIWFFHVEQQSAETDVDSYVRGNRQSISVFDAARNIVGKIASKQRA